MAAWTLSDQQWDEVDEFRSSARDARVFRNATIILLSSAGRSKSEIAETLGCSTATVDNIRGAYRRDGIGGLTPLSPPGRVSRATPEYRAAIRKAVSTQPQDLGYGFSVWSANRLRQHLKLQTGIELSEDQFRRILHQEGFSVQRPKHTMEGKRNEEDHDRAKAELRDLKKEALSDDPEEVLVFQDEVEIHLHPTLTRIWSPVAQQPEVPAPGKNEKKVVYGAVDYVTGKLTYTVANTKCGAEFLAFLLVVLKKYSGKKVRMVCDNGRFHTTKAVLEFLEANKHRIEIYWLPPYCPDLNLIERLWGHLKRTVLANVLYKNLDDLVFAFRKGVRCATLKRERMGFMYKHDDLLQEIAKEANRIPA